MKPRRTRTARSPAGTPPRISSRAVGIGDLGFGSRDFSQVLQPAGAVADAVLMNVEPVEDAEQQVASRHGLLRIRQVAAAFQLPCGAADEYVRYVVVHVLVRIAHVAAEENQRLIEQR